MSAGLFGDMGGASRRTLTSQSQPSAQAQIIISARDASRLVYDARASRIAPEDVGSVLGAYESHGLRRGCFALRSNITRAVSGEYPPVFCSLAGVCDDEEWEVVGIILNPGDPTKGELPAVLIAGAGFAFRSDCADVIRDGDWIGLRAPQVGRPSNLAGQEGIPANAVLPEVYRVDGTSVVREMDDVMAGVRSAFVNACRDAGVGVGPGGAVIAPSRLIRLCHMPSVRRQAVDARWTDLVHETLTSVVTSAVEKIAERLRDGVMGRYAWYVAARLGFPNPHWVVSPEPAIVDGVTQAMAATWKGKLIRTWDDAKRRAKAGSFSTGDDVTADMLVSRFFAEQFEYRRRRTIGMCIAQSQARDTIVDVLVVQH